MSSNTPDAPSAAKPSGMVSFSFGDPVPVTEARDLMDYLECPLMSRWYEPPLDWEILARSRRANPHHESALIIKRNVLLSTYLHHPLLSRADFGALVDNWLTFGNGYLQIIKNRFGQALRLQPLLTKYMRRGADLSQYWWVPRYGMEQAFQPGEVMHLMQSDLSQSVYGLPEYLGALQSAWLNEASTLFRRKYFLNGSHAGFILYISDPAQKEDDIEAMRKALKESKGIGNFRNLFLYSPNGKKDGIQVIPLSEVAAKDEFYNIKKVTRDDVMAGHRVPPQMMCLIPETTGGFGDAEQAARVFYIHEIQPLQQRLLEINDRLGLEVVRFGPYALMPAAVSESKPAIVR